MAKFTSFIFIITLAFVGKCSGTFSQSPEEERGWEIFNDHMSVVRNQKTNDYLPDFLQKVHTTIDFEMIFTMVRSVQQGPLEELEIFSKNSHESLTEYEEALREMYFEWKIASLVDETAQNFLKDRIKQRDDIWKEFNENDDD